MEGVAVSAGSSARNDARLDRSAGSLDPFDHNGATLSTELVITTDAGQRMVFALDPATTPETTFTAGTLG